MLASGPNTTCPEAHPINSQKSGKDQFPAVHIVHSFTHSVNHALSFSPGEGGGGEARGEAGKISLDASNSSSSSLLHARQSTCAYTLVSMLTKALNSLQWQCQA